MTDTSPKHAPRPRSVSPRPSSQTGHASFQNAHDVSPEELSDECQRLRDENRQLQLRILGVNELARLLQERSDAVKILEEKNKRLEVAVVRLENRYANLERKMQKGGQVPGVKQGISPFIPGPSKQILEGLMKENSELKKTLNNLQKRGGSGYLEAVKTNQLEEVIDNQKQEIEFLKEQVNKLTSTGLPEGSEEKSRGGLLSLPSGVSDSGPLKRQLIKMEHAMKVKDRFCSLLSQQVSELQKRLTLAKLDLIDGPPQSGPGDVVNESQQSSTNPPPQSDIPPSSSDGGSYEELFKQEKETLQRERNERRALVEKMGDVERELKAKRAEIDRLTQDIDSMETYQSTLISEKTELNQQLKQVQRELESQRDGGEDSGRGTSSFSGGSGRMQELEKRNGELEKVLESTIAHYTAEVSKRDKELDVLQTQLEESNFNRAVADSKLQQEENLRKQKINEMQEKITDLEDDVEAQRSYASDLAIKNRDWEIMFQKLKASRPSSSSQGYGTSGQSYGFLQSGGAPHLIVGDPNRAMAMVKDSAGSQSGAMQKKIPSVPVLSRGGDPPTQQQATPPQVHKPPPTQLSLGGQQQLASRSGQHGRPLSPASQQQQLQYYKQQQAAAALQTPATPVAHFQGSQSMMGGRAYSPTRNQQQYTNPQQYPGHTPSSSIGMGMVRTLSGNQPSVTSGAYARSHTMPLATLSTTPTTGTILRAPSNYPPYNTVAGGYYEFPSNQGSNMSTSSTYYHNMGGSSGPSGQPVSGTGYTGSSGMRQMSNDSAYDSGSLPSARPPPTSDNRSTSPYDHYGGSSGYPHPR